MRLSNFLKKFKDFFYKFIFYFKIFLNFISKILNFFAIILIQFYKHLISPFFLPSCKFVPTCSSYALGAYKKYNFFKATFLTIKRIIRCNPFSKGGYDPLP